MRLVVFLLLMVSILFSDEYFTVASNFLKYKHITKSIKLEKNLKFDNKLVAKLYELKGGGYIIVPISHKFSPIKAYSFKNNFSELPKKFKEYILSELSSSVFTRSFEDTNQKRWELLKNIDAKYIKERDYIPNTNLLQTTWNQNYPYNKYFPKKNGKLTCVGCIQVAQAQLMKYHSYPQKARGVFVNSNGERVVFNRYYNWENMPSSLTNVDEDYKIDEVALLLKDLAIANSAKYGTFEEGGTGASLNEEVLIYNFKYSKDIKSAVLGDISKDEFFSIIKSQIDKRLPVLISFPGHMTVADGYQDDDTGNYIHINMGWGGQDDNYYNLDEIVQTTNYTFQTDSLRMIYNIKPCSGSDCVENLEEQDKIVATNINGKFDYAYDSDVYSLYLNGKTTFNGESDYSILAFFYSIYDSSYKLIGIYDKDEVLDLPPDLYHIKISLCNQGCWGYDESHSSYSLKIKTNDLTENEKKELNSSPIFEMNKSEYIIDKQKKILINAYTLSDDENITFKVYSDSDVVEATINKNILTLRPKKYDSFTTVRVEAISSNNKISYKDILIYTSKEKIYFGKEFDIKGEFDSQSDYDKYKLFLEGKCSISGTNGYSNQTFYTALLDSYNNSISPMNDKKILTTSLNKDEYILDVSLMQNPEKGYGSYYKYDKDHSNYMLSISCPTSTITLKDILKNYNKELNDTTILPLKKGWNLVSLDLNISKIPSKVDLIWQYKNKKWSAFSNDEYIQKLLDKNNISLIKEIVVEDGTWIRAKQDINITIKNPSTFKNTHFNLGWTLAGSAKEIKTDELYCKNNTKPISLWIYEGGWKLKTDRDIKTDLETFDTISKNRGFWVNCK